MDAGMHPQMVVDDVGRLVAIATGSDAITEHECGSDALQRGLTHGQPAEAATVAIALRKHLAGGNDLETFVYPNLMQTKRIRAGFGHWSYGERWEGGVLEASLVCDVGQKAVPFGDAWIDKALRLFEEDQAGAWDASSCGFRVRGLARVEQLHAFAEAIASAKAMFAGTFLGTAPGDRSLSGVIIAIEPLLPASAQVAMREAQSKFEASVRLETRSRVEELRPLRAKLVGRSIVHVWPVWRDQVVDGEVVYAINPGLGVDASYFGPYEFDQLHDWLARGAVDRLRPRTRQTDEREEACATLSPQV